MKRTIIGAALAAAIALTTTPAFADEQPGLVTSCNDPAGAGGPCEPRTQQVVECWLPQPHGDFLGGRQRSDGTWEARILTSTGEVAAHDLGPCVEILPGVWVASSDAAAVQAYLWHLATEAQGITDERLLPALDWYVWDQVAGCESGWNWSLRGRRYDGGLQILHATWRAFGGTEFASRPSDATREQQIEVARRILTAGGWDQFPGCSSRLGYR